FSTYVIILVNTHVKIKYKIAAKIYGSQNLAYAPATTFAAYKMSVAAITVTSEESFNKAIHSFPKGGTILRNAWGNTICRIARPCGIPIDLAASICPLSIELIPARIISALYAEQFNVRATAPDTKNPNECPNTVGITAK